MNGIPERKWQASEGTGSGMLTAKPGEEIMDSNKKINFLFMAKNPDQANPVRCVLLTRAPCMKGYNVRS